jgi:hypothetical protein
MTDAPSAARCLAMEAPIPFDAPVTTATLPANLFIVFQAPREATFIIKMSFAIALSLL